MFFISKTYFQIHSKNDLQNDFEHDINSDPTIYFKYGIGNYVKKFKKCTTRFENDFKDAFKHDFKSEFRDEFNNDFNTDFENAFKNDSKHDFKHGANIVRNEGTLHAARGYRLLGARK